jgi:hypothetical protein
MASINGMVMRIVDLRVTEVREGCRNLNNEKLHNLYSS